jgi:hypothetical protein
MRKWNLSQAIASEFRLGRRDWILMVTEYNWRTIVQSLQAGRGGVREYNTPLCAELCSVLCRPAGVQCVYNYTQGNSNLAPRNLRKCKQRQESFMKEFCHIFQY